ncbi:MAG: signal peptidase I [Lachnospiraceae bacterium]|jgi:signal peptidase I|nr:signal peptidase I [Lachnospiraceae bacterium]
MKRLKPLFVPASAVVLAAILNTFVLVNAHVPSGSMEPAIPSGSMVIGNRLAYRTEEPAAGDVIIFRHRETGENWLIKRVVAIPGQMFAVRQGRVYIDGQLLDETYVPHFSADDYPETLVPEGCYIVLGDNRTASGDSRTWEDPFVRREDILARAWFVYFPVFHTLSRTG